ncbi:hypothetical protein [Tenacibaculum sp.]|uniref:hypothetical protein n=1 Tax=Tenacibaculum sp. TaxID=1906242 RepID=UPI003AA92161
MKKKLLLITLIFFVSISSTILAQTEQRLRVKELEFDGVKKDEYLGDKLISIDDLQAKTKAKCTEFRCEGYENISFKKYDIQHTLRMEKLIRSIQGKAIRDWLFIQEKIVKTELDKINFTKTTSKYGDHYKAARGIYFEKLERGITKNNLNYYNQSYGNSIKSKKTKGMSIMKDIKRLTLRRQEIKNGNINNSSYGSYKYKGKPLSYYKSLKEVSNLLKSELSNYYNNDVAINDNQRIKNRLNQMIKDMSPSSVSKDLMLKRKNFFIDLLNRKESHFKSFSNWNELNLMQKYINKVYKGNNPGTVWPKDFGTKKFVLSHAKSKKLGSLTVFHPNYWKVILKNKYKNSWLYNSKAKADHAKLKQAEINKLIASTPINANLAVDFIVKDINITDLNQLEWLNSIPEKEANRIKGILQMAKTSWGSDLDLGSIYRQKKEIEIERIKNAGLVVQMVKTLGITNSTQKSWLYNNIPEATQMRFFVDANKVRGVVKANAKTFSIKITQILSNQNLTSSQKYNQFIIAYNSFDPILPNTAQKKDYEAKIKHYINYFKRRGNHEFANYLENLLPINSSFSKEDYIKLYETIREQKLNYFYALLQEIGLATFDAFKPVIEMALWEVGGGLALKALSKLPVRYLTTPIKNVITRLRTPASSAFSNLKHAKKFGIQSYKQLGKQFKELGISAKQLGVEKHHLFEQRFVKQLGDKLGRNTDDWLSIVVEKTNKLAQSEHYKFTQAWKKAIGYDGQAAGWTKKTTSSATIDDIYMAAKEIYKDYPEILKALGL